MGVFKFHMSQLQIPEVFGPVRKGLVPKKFGVILGEDWVPHCQGHSTLSQPAAEMVMGWFPSADS